MSVLGCFCSPQVFSVQTPLSPVQQAVRSPVVANRISLLRMEKRIRQLERLLTSEQNQKSDLEDELRAKEKELSEKGL
jgi:hypothetical protein